MDYIKTISKLFVSLLLACVVVNVGYAAGMQIKPGLWETKSQVTSPGGTQENISQDCIQESEISPEKMMDDNQGCEVTDSSSNSNSMHWSIACSNDGVSMTGSGQAKSSGDMITGGMDIKANFGGQEIMMNTKWEGRRIGDCK